VFVWRRALVLAVLAGCAGVVWSVTERLSVANESEVPGAMACSQGGVERPATLTAEETVVSGVARVRARSEGATTSVAGGACPRFYTARPGDTLWSIALEFGGGGDPRPLVARLEAQIGGQVLQPGDLLAVP
jgi:nucleoid-associated protein YgaU